MQFLSLSGQGLEEESVRESNCEKRRGEIVRIPFYRQQMIHYDNSSLFQRFLLHSRATAENIPSKYPMIPTKNVLIQCDNSKVRVIRA